MEGVREGRHLAAIMFVDMVGYSALMQESEARAIALVRELWDLVRPILATHGGREVDLAGDGMLMEFSGALAAARCALDIHAALRERNRMHPDAPVRVRAGLHLGDIEHRDGRIYGDGVNIAARVLALSPGGGLAFTAHVRDQLLNVLEQAPQPLGRKLLKNIKTPLELWCLPGPDCSAADLAAAKGAAPAETTQRRWRFGNAVFDERTLELNVAGVAIELEKQALDVLLFLLHHAGEVVTKEEVLEGVWPGGGGSVDRLAACVTQLRAALGEDTIKTVHGFGFRFAADVQVEAHGSADARQLDFREGDRVAQRPLWSLVRHLGGGGHGEVWLARHDKTKEERVFKFALAPEHLASLKREITLSRLLNDTLGARGCFVRVLEWNLEHAPYFIECEFSRGGSLVDWAQAQGGIEKVPLATRLEIAAQTAEALAAAHSVGVLHKDLKPANILIEPEPLKVKLTDFGSGGVLDTEKLAELGITRMGFTKTVLRSDSDSGTVLYLAPEILRGQPWTSKADIYALGLILFQLIVGDFRRTLAPGWEGEVANDFLRDDVKLAAAGNSEQRLGDAARLAQRLRTLDQRGAKREEETLAAAKLLKQQQAIERFRRRRWYTAGVTTLLMLTLIFGFFFWYDTFQAYGEAVGLRGVVEDATDSAIERGDLDQAGWMLNKVYWVQWRRTFHTPLDTDFEISTLMRSARLSATRGWWGDADYICQDALDKEKHSLFGTDEEFAKLLAECRGFRAIAIPALEKKVARYQAIFATARERGQPVIFDNNVESKRPEFVIKAWSDDLAHARAAPPLEPKGPNPYPYGPPPK